MDLMTIGLESGITILLFVLGLVIVIGAQWYISSVYKKYKRVKVNKDLTGFEVARKILDKNGLKDVHIVEVNGHLSDHYDPRRKVVRLSKDIFHGNSIASVSVAAHEVGHAIQDKDNYTFLRVRAALVPFVNLVSYLGFFSIFIAILSSITSYLIIGIGVILVTILFQLVTLPVEFDASSRAKRELINLNLVNDDESKQVHTMLNAAAMTYVAGLISSILNLLRLIIMLRDSD